jgi:riboflavin kinase/FMN adenylyltransferase
MVITFDRQPRELFDANYHPQLLTTQKNKVFLLSLFEVDYVVVLPFTMEMARLSAHDFMQQVLKDKLNVKLLRLGYDNRFGHGRKEGFEDYVRYGKDMGITVLQGNPLKLEGYSEPVSSSLIRRLIVEDGNVKDAKTLMTRPFVLMGTIKPGEHIGSTLGFPTANLEPDDDGKLIPASGVYAVKAILGYAFIKPAMMNIGTRPTFNGQKQTLEVNIFDFEGNLYGKQIIVAFIERLRDERRFDSPEALVAQLEKDKQQVEQILNQTK